MKTLRFFLKLTAHTLGELCQRRWLLAELALLCLFLPLCIGPAAQELLSGGISFSGITLAVTAPEGDSIPRFLEQYMGNMSDVSQYCSFQAMDEAAAALEAGDVTAILALPENFIQGIMDGTNPDVQLIVSSDRPLESLLTLWVGQSAADLLAAVQSGIYTVLETYEAAAPEGLSWEQIKLDINLRYISWTLNRQDMFRLREASATQTLPVQFHYGLSLLAYLGLSAAPLFFGIYGKGQAAFRRRLRCLGWGSLLSYFSGLAACTVVIFLLAAFPVLLLTQGPLLPSLGAAALFALFCAVFGGLCCLLTASTASCGGLAFSLALLSIGAAGGILPPVLLPQTLREVCWLSPVTWLRALTAMPAGYPAESRCLIAAAVSTLLAMALSAALFHRRTVGQEVVV